MTTGRLVVLAGTGTDVGKTHVADALIRAGGTPRRRTAWKPYESGVVTTQPSDSERLRTAVDSAPPEAGWRLHPPLRRWAAPLAPPVAAWEEGAPLDHGPLLDELDRLRAEADVVLLELAGGLFAPLSATWLGSDLVRHVSGATLVVVAANRLGVLHDVIATARAARAEGIGVDHLVLCEQALPDPSAAHNPRLLRDLLPATIAIHGVAHGPARTLADSPTIRALAKQLFETQAT